MRKNILETMYDAYIEEGRDMFIIEDSTDTERIAFINGFMAGLRCLGVDPENIIHNETGNSLIDDADELLNWKMDAN